MNHLMRELLDELEAEGTTATNFITDESILATYRVDLEWKIQSCLSACLDDVRIHLREFENDYKEDE